MKRFSGGVKIYMWGLSQAVTALENSATETFADMDTSAGRNNFRSEVNNIEYLMRRLIAAHDRLEANDALKLRGLGGVRHD